MLPRPAICSAALCLPSAAPLRKPLKCCARVKPPSQTPVWCSRKFTSQEVKLIRYSRNCASICKSPQTQATSGKPNAGSRNLASNPRPQGALPTSRAPRFTEPDYAAFLGSLRPDGNPNPGNSSRTCQHGLHSKSDEECFDIFVAYRQTIRLWK